MKRIFLLATVAVALLGCGGHSHGTEGDGHEHAHIHGFTAYTHAFEYFLQHEGLSVGEKSCITLYVTDLSSFKPAEPSVAEVVLTVGSKSVSQKSDAAHKGVFHFDFVPESAGCGMLYVKVGDRNG